MSTQKIVIMGGGIAGLATALSLKSRPCSVTIIERDPEPTPTQPGNAFENWKRGGVPQFRHSHMLLSRVRTIIRDNHPELLAELDAAGIKASSLDEMLPPALSQDYHPEPGDDDLLHLWGRRATFEAVLRKHVAGLSHVRFVHGAKVEGLELEPAADGFRVAGVQVVVDSERTGFPADVVIDATGKHSNLPDKLREQGVRIEEERSKSGFSYFCRHYRLAGATDKQRHGTGAILDYLWYGMFFAEDGHFSIAMACPDEEQQLAHALRRTEGFELVCNQMPGLRSWLEMSEPVSSVMGAGKLWNRWVTIPSQGAGHLVGLFCVGDSLVQTNPMYGRGCSSAFIQAQALSEAFGAASDLRTRAETYKRAVQTLLRPYFDFSVAADRLFIARGRLARGARVSLGDRLLNALYEHVWNPATLEDPFVGREAVRAMQMREASPIMTRLRVALRLITFWLTRTLIGRRPSVPVLGPPRDRLRL